MRALVTGVTGQDGSYLAEQLLSLGWEVHGLTRRPDKILAVSEMLVHYGDLGDADRLRSVVSEVMPDVIFNLGGISSVAQSWKSPELTTSVSGAAVGTLLEAAWQLQEKEGHRVRFLQASSSEIFGHAKETPQNELTPIAPTNPYGVAKALAHQLTSVYRSRGLWASNVILFNHESPRRPESFVTRKITMGAARIASGRQDKIYLGNLDSRRDWGWAPDYVDAMVRVSALADPSDFVISSGRMHSVREFAKAALQAAGIPDWEEHIEVDDRFLRPVDAVETCGDNSRLHEATGWQPLMPFEEIVKKMVYYDLHLLQEVNGSEPSTEQLQ
ncbi:GDP-mannose 4,6-dehydratase [Pseudarthrobacter phenanthrenivorans]|uniref:GDP-mannose 4,6-dehydratase n=1 Tax=Pseudarthrobacter phenanthrenivorans TaxID=361575 RepID=UPI002F357728